MVASSTTISCAPPMMARARPRPRGAGAAGSCSVGDAVAAAVVVDMASGPFGRGQVGGRRRPVQAGCGRGSRAPRAGRRCRARGRHARGWRGCRRRTCRGRRWPGACWPAGAGRRPRRPLPASLGALERGERPVELGLDEALAERRRTGRRSRCIAGTRAPSTAGESSHRPPGPQAWASRSRAGEPVSSFASSGGGELGGHRVEHQVGLGGPAPVERGLAGPDGGGHGVEGQLVVAGLDEQRHHGGEDLALALALDPGPAGRAGQAWWARLRSCWVRLDRRNCFVPSAERTSRPRPRPNAPALRCPGARLRRRGPPGTGAASGDRGSRCLASRARGR